MHESIWNELNEGEIHVRDISQFELKSEFYIHDARSIYKQEFFLFIPEALQINYSTYPKWEFYSDQTTLIRYKTPSFSLTELTDPRCETSPLNRLSKILSFYNATDQLPKAIDELKLFGNIFKVSLRERVRALLHELQFENTQETEKFPVEITRLCREIDQVCLNYRQLQTTANQVLRDEQLKRTFRYIDEFISNQVNHYLLLLDQAIHQSEHKHLSESLKVLSQHIASETHYAKINDLGPKTSSKHPFSNESILHRAGLLNKFVLEALMLDNYRFSLTEKHASLFGALAAAIAMFIYLILFAWKVSSFVINSLPVILIVVFLYVIKDRIKEWVKSTYTQYSSKWFSDYSTNIISPKGYKVGKINESFAFIKPEEVPADIQSIRNIDFNEELQALIRHETVIRYNREVILFSHPGTPGGRRKEITTIFRFNVHHLLQKASNPLEPRLFLDPYTHEVEEKFLPKVYHINLIIRNTYEQSGLVIQSEIKKYRVVVNKTGVKRVEEIG